MAVEVSFRGFVNQVRKYDWGTVYTVVHKQSKQTSPNNWETVGKDYFSVVGPEGFQENDLVDVTGTLKAELYDKKDGSGKGLGLRVTAKSMVRAERGSGKAATVSELQTIWPDVKQIADSNAPF